MEYRIFHKIIKAYIGFRIGQKCIMQKKLTICYSKIVLINLKKKKCFILKAKIMWSTLSDEQKHTYGEEYFERSLRSLEKYTKAVCYLLLESYEILIKFFYKKKIGR